MERISVSSSNISSIGYDEDSCTLEVQFNSGAIYQYFDIPLEIYNGIMQAGSAGQFFAQQIKGYYRFVKI